MGKDPGSVYLITYQEEITLVFFFPLYKGLFSHFKFSFWATYYFCDFQFTLLNVDFYLYL